MSVAEVSPEPGCVDSKLIPVMREAVITVQMILFKVLKGCVHDRYVDQVEPYHTYLAGAVINNLFGTQPLDAAVAVFASNNRSLVERELRELSSCCGLVHVPMSCLTSCIYHRQFLSSLQPYVAP